MSKAREMHDGTDRRKVLVVDDHAIVRMGLKQLINAQPDLVVCGEVGTCIEAIAMAAKVRPDIAIVDLSMGTGDGTKLCHDLQLRRPGLPILVLSMHDEVLYAERALRAGARGYIMKHESPEQILRAIRRVLDGQTCISRQMATRLAKQSASNRGGDSLLPLDRLTDRELHIFRLIGHGWTVRQIAEELVLSPKTVEAHREHIKKKLEIDSSTHLAHYAIHQTLQAQ